MGWGVAQSSPAPKCQRRGKTNHQDTEVAKEAGIADPAPTAAAYCASSGVPVPPWLQSGRLTKPAEDFNTPDPLRRAASDRGGVAERLKAADCKSALFGVRWFESSPLHQSLGSTGRFFGSGGTHGVTAQGMAEFGRV
jgi:hypothetical protein